MATTNINRRDRLARSFGFGQLPSLSIAKLVRFWTPTIGQDSQVLTELIQAANGTLGDTTNVETTDPAWVPSPASLLFGGDDLVIVGSRTINNPAYTFPKAIHRWGNYLLTAAQTVADTIGNLTLQVGSTTNADTNDPNLDPTVPRMTFAGDDYLTLATSVTVDTALSQGWVWMYSQILSHLHPVVTDGVWTGVSDTDTTNNFNVVSNRLTLDTAGMLMGYSISGHLSVFQDS